MSALRWLYALYLRWSIWEAEHWLRDCSRDKLLHGPRLATERARIAHLRVRLALAQAPRATTHAEKLERHARLPERAMALLAAAWAFAVLFGCADAHAGRRDGSLPPPPPPKHHIQPGATA